MEVHQVGKENYKLDLETWEALQMLNIELISSNHSSFIFLIFKNDWNKKLTLSYDLRYIYIYMKAIWKCYKIGTSNFF